MEHLVSIIMPVYNVEKYVKKSVNSVLQQTYKNFELLVIDDGTLDNSVQVVRQIRDERIRVFHKTNGGLSDARNFGLEQARGRYIYFIDSDDWIEPNLLEDCLVVMESENLDLVVFGYVQDNEDKYGNLTYSKQFIPFNKTFFRKDKDLKIDELEFRLLGYAWNKVYRKSFIDEHNLRFEKGTSLVEDILFNSSALIQTDRLRFIENVYYHYSNRPVETLMKVYHENSFELKVKRTKFLERFFETWEVNESLKNEILSFSLVLGIRSCVHNLFAYKNNLSLRTKRAYIRKMVNHPLTIRLIDHYNAKSWKDRLYKAMIKNKKSVFIAISTYRIK